MDRFWRWCSFASVVAGVWLRVCGLAASPLWYDEAVSLYMARLPILQTVRGQALDFSPPLNELLMAVSIRLVGDSVIGVRLPALAASLVALALAWKLSQAFGVAGRSCNGITVNQPAAGHALALALVSLLPYQLYLAQDGRIYSVMTALYLAALWFAIHGRPAGLSAACGLLLYCHATGFFYVATALALAVYTYRQAWPRWIVCGLVAVASWLPWLPASLASATRHHWIDVSGSLLFTSLERSVFVDSLDRMGGQLWLVVALMVIIASLAASVVIAIRNRELLPLALAAVVPLFLMLVATPFKNVIIYRTLSPMTIPMLLFFGTTLTRYPITRAVLVGNWIALLVFGLAGWNPASKGGHLGQLAAVIAGDTRPGVVVYHASATTLLPMRELLPAHRHYLLDEPAHTGLLSDELRELFSLDRRPLETVSYRVVYVAWPREPLLSTQANARMAAYVERGQWVGSADYWQAAKVELWRVP